MRDGLRVCTLLGVLLALLSSMPAQAKITPLPKPPGMTTAPAVKKPAKVATAPTHEGAFIAPLARPEDNAPAKPQAKTPAKSQAKTPAKASANVPVSPPSTPVVPRTGDPPGETPAHTPPPQPAVSNGGHAIVPSLEFSKGGRDEAAARIESGLARLLPTPLGLVGIHDALPASDTWPSWVLAAFTMLASAEAFLLTRLLRHRRIVQPSDF